MLTTATCARAAQPASLTFTHDDWEIACDNTRSCRVAGYHAGTSDGSVPLPVSVLLTRAAGPYEPVQGKLQIGLPEEHQADADWLHEVSLTMRINGEPAGKVVFNRNESAFDLTPQQTALLIASLTRPSKIHWSDGKHIWELSDQGAAAVLLKMDEFQGRLDTPGALMRKGARDERSVLPSLPPPLVQAAAVPADDSMRLSRSSLKAIRVAVTASMQDCIDPLLGQPRSELVVRRLSATKLLASTNCGTTAYNDGDAYWTINAKPPYSPVLVSDYASFYDKGVIRTSLKLHSSGGGAWSLPVLVTTVRPNSRR